MQHFSLCSKEICPLVEPQPKQTVPFQRQAIWAKPVHPAFVAVRKKLPETGIANRALMVRADVEWHYQPAE
jgi:hypothetical protein